MNACACSGVYISVHLQLRKSTTSYFYIFVLLLLFTSAAFYFCCFVLLQLHISTASYLYSIILLHFSDRGCAHLRTRDSSNVPKLERRDVMLPPDTYLTQHTKRLDGFLPALSSDTGKNSPPADDMAVPIKKVIALHATRPPAGQPAARL